MEIWKRLAIAAGVVLLAYLVAKAADRALARRELAPEVATRYRVLRRSVMFAIVAIGVLSALMVIPQVRAIAGAILASGAVIGLIVGFAAQRTLGNFVAGIMIAFTQPVRLGDRVALEEVDGVVEEIGLTYTWIRSEESLFVVPNEKLASDTIRNFTIRSPEKVAEVTVQVPLAQDLDAVLGALAAETDAEVFVSALGEGAATLTVRQDATSEPDARHLERELRVRTHRALRAAGVYA